MKYQLNHSFCKWNDQCFELMNTNFFAGFPHSQNDMVGSIHPAVNVISVQLAPPIWSCRINVVGSTASIIIGKKTVFTTVIGWDEIEIAVFELFFSPYCFWRLKYCNTFQIYFFKSKHHRVVTLKNAFWLKNHVTFLKERILHSYAKTFRTLRWENR